MGVQTTVRSDQTWGIVGDIAFGGPYRAEPGILASGSAANNVIGRAFTRVAANDNTVAAGGAALTFGGILINSKEYATSGTASGALETTLALPNGTPVSLLLMGYVWVTLSGDAAVGDDVCYVDATGVLFAVDAGAAAGTNNTKIPGAKIAYFNTSGAGLAVVRLTN